MPASQIKHNQNRGHNLPDCLKTRITPEDKQLTEQSAASCDQAMLFLHQLSLPLP